MFRLLLKHQEEANKLRDGAGGRGLKRKSAASCDEDNRQPRGMNKNIKRCHTPAINDSCTRSIRDLKITTNCFCAHNPP